jgi:tRNA 2-selenouridine synthase
LRAEGAQVLDLEGLANHRSSVLGILPGQPQPSQKHFDTLLWNELRLFDPHKPVYIESESRKVGNLAVPESLIMAMRASSCYKLELADDERVLLLLEDYDFFVKDPALFCKRLDALVAIRGKQVVEEWQSLIMSGSVEKVVRDLLLTHYDPTYFASMQRNFDQIDQAQVISAMDRSQQSMKLLAQALTQT